MTQYIYSDLDFKSPFLVTYVATALFSLYLPLWRVWVYIGYVEDPPWCAQSIYTPHRDIIHSLPRRLEKSENASQRIHWKQTCPLIAPDVDEEISSTTKAVNGIPYQTTSIVEGEVPAGRLCSSDSDDAPEGLLCEGASKVRHRTPTARPSCLLATTSISRRCQ